MATYRLLIAAVLILMWVVLAASAGDGVSDVSQGSGLLLTNLDTADASQNEQLSAAAFQPIGFGLFQISFLSVSAIAAPLAWRRPDDDSYQLNCAFLL